MGLDILLPLLTGFLIFLFGMKVMEGALHRWAGAYLKHFLEKFTKTPLRGMVTGAGITAALQSSSAITVITIGLVNAKILSYPRTIGIILGTNIGTCITTELIGLNLNQYALPLLIGSSTIWVLSWSLPKRLEGHYYKLKSWINAIRYTSLAISGFACILLGIIVMQSIVDSLQSRGLFVWFLEQSSKSLMWGVVAGTVLTAIIQSSSAAIAITMSLASFQVISIELGIAIILGCNIGTCMTSLLASIGGSKSGQLVAWTHVLLNVGGAAIFFPLIWLLKDLSIFLSDQPSGQLAHAQTIFNILCSLMALPLCYVFKNKIH